MTEGKIMKALSGFYYVKSDHEIYTCKGRGVFRNQKINPLVGDNVFFDKTDNGEGYITKIKHRENELERPPIANVSQGLIVTSVVEPAFSTLLLDRFIVLLESKQIKPIICLTKMDLATDDAQKQMQQYAEDYERIGYPTLSISLSPEGEGKGMPLLSYLQDEVTVLVGQSGVGKSTLLNRLNPNLQLETKEISQSLGRGKHTTRHVELMKVNGGLVADTPGFSALEFSELAAEDLAACFIDMAPYQHACKFRSCLHDKEPHCAVKQAVQEGQIFSRRYEHYIAFLHDILSRKPRYS